MLELKTNGKSNGNGTIHGLRVDRVLHSRVLEAPLVAPRRGVMLHYDDSSSDDGALAWFQDPDCRNGYTWLVLDDGKIVELADPRKRTPHAGACLTRAANSAFYGIAAATNGRVLATPSQLESIVSLCVVLFRHHAWPAAEVETRIVGHDQQAIWTPSYTRAAGLADTVAAPLWGRVGRKVDPRGQRSDGRPIIDVAAVRKQVARRLEPRGEQ